MKLTPQLERSMTRVEQSIAALLKYSPGQARDREGQFSSGGGGGGGFSKPSSSGGGKGSAEGKKLAKDPKARGQVVKQAATVLKGATGKAARYVGKQIADEWKFHVDALKGIGKLMTGKKPTRKEMRNIASFAAHTALMAAFPGGALTSKLGVGGAFLAKRVVSSLAFRTVDKTVSKTLGAPSFFVEKDFSKLSEPERKAALIKAIELGVKQALDQFVANQIPDDIWDEV